MKKTRRGLVCSACAPGYNFINNLKLFPSSGRRSRAGPANMGLEYTFLKGRGALNEASASAGPIAERGLTSVSPEIVELIPESVARENIIMPLAFDGETIT